MLKVGRIENSIIWLFKICSNNGMLRKSEVSLNETLHQFLIFWWSRKLFPRHAAAHLSEALKTLPKKLTTQLLFRIDYKIAYKNEVLCNTYCPMGPIRMNHPCTMFWCVPRVLSVPRFLCVPRFLYVPRFLCLSVASSEMAFVTVDFPLFNSNSQMCRDNFRNYSYCHQLRKFTTLHLTERF